MHATRALTWVLGAALSLAGLAGCEDHPAPTGCTSAATCPGADTECQQRACTNGACGWSYTADGTAIGAQIAHDCTTIVCDGHGATKIITNDADLPIDGNDCTDDVCVGGVASNPPRAAGSTCGAGLLCDGAGVCVGCAAATECPGTDTTCRTRTCAAGACGFSNTADGTTCDDGDASTTGDVCTGGVCAGVDHCLGVTCTALDQCHVAGACVDHATGACSNPHQTDGTACDDGDPTTAGDVCTGGVCGGVDHCVGVTCTPLDQCHVAGVCDHATGVCTNPTQTDGTTCDDGNAATTGDVCAGGVCAGVDHCAGVTCTALDQCHVAGVCDHATGICTNPTQTDGTVCDDGSPATTGDVCTGGVCAGVDHCVGVTCVPLDQCHVAGLCDHATGVCTDPTKDDGAACDDGDANTAGDVCTSGLCAGIDHCVGVTCTALDQCHVAGICVDHATGACSNPTKTDGAACNDNNASTVGDVCTNGACAGVDHCVGVTCAALDQCHVAGTCIDHATGACSNPTKTDGTTCDDGNASTAGDVCTNGTCAGIDHCVGVTCAALDQCHVAGVCDHATGACSNPNKTDGATCDDGNPATTGDVCTGGLCGGVDKCAGVTCVALDQCHRVGVCAPATGSCTTPVKTDGTACDDSDANTTGDVCTGGVCAGVDHCLGVICTALDQCHVAGVCVDHATGACSTPNQTDGTPCDDGNPATLGDVCVGGLCGGVDLCAGVTCAPLDQCHIAGVCAPATGLCTTPTKTDGTVCDDGNANTAGDVCTGGVCAGVDHCVAVTCAALDQCHLAGTCDHATGVCTDPPAVDGTVCDDGNPNTAGDVCTGGVCGGVDHCVGVTCQALDLCHVAGTCDHATGLCTDPAQPDGTACDDGNACTKTDSCQAGVCTGASPVICTALDACHAAGSCDTATGACSNPAQPDGTTCNDGNACTLTDSCQAGACTGANPVLCGASDQCHDVGVCNPASGVCSDPAKADGAACSDGNACTKTDSCQAGVCTGASPVVCAASDQCHDIGVCDPGTGTCSSPTKADGTACSDGNACTQTDTCLSGVCTGANPVICAVPDQCHLPGACDTSTGVCSNPAKPDGSTCSDGNVCTTDSCQAGSCAGILVSVGTDCGGGKECDSVGACIVPPAVASTTPDDGATVPANTTVAVTFTVAMTPATLTAQTVAGACSGSIQVSGNNFTTCVAFAAAAPTMTVSNTVATLTPAPGLLVNRTYKIRVTTAAAGATGLAVPAQYTSTTGFTTTNPLLAGSGVVVSQVYGAGGNVGAVYTNDFIELHNRGTTAVSLAGWSVQYGSATGTTWTNKTNLAGTIQPGGFFLIQEAGGTNGSALPTADLTGTINLAATAGKVALVNNTTALSGACPTGGQIIDFVGFGATANCSETSPAPAPSTTTADLRSLSCTDAGNNATDFSVGTPTPRNSAYPAFLCSPSQNESGSASEIKYCDTQFPLTLTGVTAGSAQTVYGQVWDDRYGHNDAAITVQFGWGLASLNPEYQAGWSWVATTYNGLQADNNDEYLASFSAPAAGTYAYAFRVSLDGGATWTYCDNHQADNGAGSDPGLTFDFENEGVLTTQ